MSADSSLSGSVVRRYRRGSTAFCAAAAILIGYALQISNGNYDGPALRLVAAGTVLALVGMLYRTARRGLASFWDSAIWAICLGGLAWQFHILVITEPLMDASVAIQYFYYWIALPALALTLAGAILLPIWWRGRVFIPLLLLTYLGTGVYLLHRSNNPYIDVFRVVRDSCQAVSRGVDPYSIDFPDIYAGRPDWDAAFYGPGTVYNGRAHFGYPYMPLSFAVAYAGYALGGDYRLGNLLAITAAAGFLAYARRGRVGAAGAGLLLLTPRGFYVLEQGWSEPAVVVCLALVVFCACRQRAWLPWAVGLLMVSKQYVFLAAPAALLLLPRPWHWKTAWPFFGKAAAIGAAVTLPMVLWNVQAFWGSAIEIQFKQPFRSDSLSYAAALVHAGGPHLPAWFAFAAAGVAALLCVWKAGAGPAGFCGATAVIYLIFFAFAKQAFCNYYYFTIGALCCTVAAGHAGRPRWKITDPLGNR